MAGNTKLTADSFNSEDKNYPGGAWRGTANTSRLPRNFSLELVN